MLAHTVTLREPGKANSPVFIVMGGLTYQLSGFLLILLGNGRFHSMKQIPQ